MSDICFSGPQLVFLAAIWAVIQSAMLALFSGWINSLKDSVREARSERDRAMTGWEDTINLGEKAVRRERRKS